MVSFHRSGVILECLSLVALHVPKDSSFRKNLLSYINDLEIFLTREWKNNPQMWSFATARALSLRWHSGDLKKAKQRSKTKSWAKEHVVRFLGRMGKSETEDDYGLLAKLGAGSYTCAPLQGLTSLASILQDHTLVTAIIQLLEKDIDHYHISESAHPEGLHPFTAESPGVSGTFFRDEGQMKMENRRSLRTDDSAMCLIALTQALRILESVTTLSLKGLVQEGTNEGEL